jgi:hypothetical protein
MRISKSVLKTLLVSLALLTLVVFGAAVGARKWKLYDASPQNPKDNSKQQLQPTDALPPVVSEIKGLEVISTFIDADGMANIVIINRTHKTILGIGLAAGNRTFTDDTGMSQDNPKPLILPNESYTFKESASNLPANKPIRVSVVLYDDGSEEGDATQRKYIHDERERQKEKRLHQAKEKP